MKKTGATKAKPPTGPRGSVASKAPGSSSAVKNGGTGLPAPPPVSGKVSPSVSAAAAGSQHSSPSRAGLATPSKPSLPASDAKIPLNLPPMTPSVVTETSPQRAAARSKPKPLAPAALASANSSAKRKSAASKAPPLPPQLPALPVEVKEALQYVEHINSCIVRRSLIDDPPTSFLTSTGGTENPADESQPERNVAAVPLSLQGSPRGGNPTNSPRAPPASPRKGGGGLEAMVLLRTMHTHGNKLLGWAQKVEADQSPTSSITAEAEKCIQVHSGELIAALVALIKQLKHWNEAHVAEHMKLPKTKALFDECTKQVAALHAAAATTATIQRLIREKDLVRAKQLSVGFAPPPTPTPEAGQRSRVPNTPNTSNNPRRAIQRSGSTLSNHNGGSPNTELPPRPPAPPLVLWLQRSWIPAMEQWNSILETTSKALQSGDKGVMQDALSSARSLAVTNGTLLQEILLPGESLTALLEKHVEVPLTTKVDLTSKKLEAIQHLTSVLEVHDFTQLAAAVQATEALASVLTAAEKEEVEKAQNLLIGMQKVAKTTVQLTIAQRSGDMATLVRSVTLANQLILSQKLSPDLEQCRAATEVGTKLLAQPISNSAQAFANVRPEDLIVEHLPSAVWAAELSELYQAVTKRMAELMEHNAAKSKVASSLPDIRSHLRRQGSSSFYGDDVTTPAARPTMDNNQARLLLQRCEAAGVSGPEVDELKELLQSATELQLKLHYDSALKLVAIPQEHKTDWAFVLNAIRNALRFPATPPAGGGKPPLGTKGVKKSPPPPLEPTPPPVDLRIRYQDAEGDFITIADAEDWRIMLRNRALGEGSHISVPLASTATLSSTVLMGSNKIELYADKPQPRPSLPGEVPSPDASGSKHHAAAATPSPPTAIAFKGPPAARPSAVKTKPHVSAVQPPKPPPPPPPPAANSSSRSPPREPTLQVVGHGASPGHTTAASPSLSDTMGSTTSSNRKYFSELGSKAPASRPIGLWIPPADPVELHTIASTASTTPSAMPPMATDTKQPPTEEKEADAAPHEVGTWERPEQPIELQTVASVETTETQAQRRADLQNTLAELKKMHTDLAKRRLSAAEEAGSSPGAVRAAGSPATPQHKRPPSQGNESAEKGATHAQRASVVAKKPIVKRAPMAPLLAVGKTDGSSSAPAKIQGGPKAVQKPPQFAMVGTKANSSSAKK